MQIEERHWVHAQSLLDIILQVQTGHSPEAGLHLLMQHTRTLLDVQHSCLVMIEPRSKKWRTLLWVGEHAVDVFSPSRTSFTTFIDRILRTSDADVARLRVWESAVNDSQSFSATPFYMNGCVAGLIACAGETPLDEESKKNAIILAHMCSIILENSRHERINRFTIEEKTKSDILRSNLIALSSHEMRTPLSVILGYADLLRDIGPEELLHTVEAIRKSGKSLLDTVGSMTNLMDILGAYASCSVFDVSHFESKIRQSLQHNKIHFTNIDCNEIFCDINLIVNILTLISDELKYDEDILVVASKENKGTRVDIETGISSDSLFVQYLNIEQNSHHLDIDKFNQNSFISAFKISNIIAMHEGWIQTQPSPTSEGTLITLWFPDLPLSRFDY